MAGEDLAAVAAEELDGGGGGRGAEFEGVEGRSNHDSWVVG